MKTEEDIESAPRNSSADKQKSKKKKGTTHRHIGPNARAFSSGLAFCTTCDADKILRVTEKEKESERDSRAAKK